MSRYLIAVGGAPLHGKTTIAKRLSRELGFYHKDVDELRVDVFGYANLQPPNRSLVDLRPLHTDKRERLSQDYMLEGMVRGFLEAGESIIISAMLASMAQLGRLRETAERNNAHFKLIHCFPLNMTREEVERRIADSPPFGTAYNVRQPVTWEQYLWARDQMETWTLPHLILDTMRPLEECIKRALAYISMFL
jgi:predicted kinase